MKNVMLLISMLVTAFSLSANEYQEVLTSYATNQVKAIAADPEIIAAVKKQNVENKDLTQDQIISLDKKWRAEVGQSSAPMIEQTLASPTSKKLQDMQQGSSGAIT